MSTIALLTDFGTRDWYVGAIKGVLRARCPGAQLVDITHEVPPQDVVAGAVTLAAAAPSFPSKTVFLVVVDPGVGSRRALLAVMAGGRFFVGPDNGILSLALSAYQRSRIIRLTQPRYWAPRVSQTFHGRDIMAPVAAHLAAGRSLDHLGLPQQHATSLKLPSIRRHKTGWVGAVLHIDGFGNLITNVPAHAVTSTRSRSRIRVRCRRRSARVVSSYMEGRAREIVAVIGSWGLIELAVFKGSAAQRLKARRGDRVDVIIE